MHSETTTISVARPGAARLRRFAALAIIAAALSGCQTAHVAQPLTAKYGTNDPAVEMNFWHTLETRSVTSYDDAFHGLLLFTDGSDPAADYAGRVKVLKQRGWLDADFDSPADEGVQRGELAVVLVHALQIKGGFTMRVLGAGPRYALRELEFVQVYPPSSDYQVFSGAQYLALIGRVDDYVRQNKPDLFKAAVAAAEPVNPPNAPQREVK